MPRIDHPASVDETVRLLAEPNVRLIAGGVAILLRVRLGGVPADHFVAVGRLPALRQIEVDATGDVGVGAAVTLAELAASRVAWQHVPLLAAAAAAAASPAIRSIATIAGNLVDAPAGSDLIAASMALDATLEIRSARGSRRLPLGATAPESFPALDAGELVAGIRLPSSARAGWSLQRLQTQGRADRPATTIALQIAAAEGRIVGLRAAASFVADRPLALPELEGAATGARVDQAAGGRLDGVVAEAAIAAIDRALDQGSVLLDDGRASARYRREVFPILVRRALVEAAESLAS